MRDFGEIIALAAKRKGGLQAPEHCAHAVDKFLMGATTVPR